MHFSFHFQLGTREFKFNFSLTGFFFNFYHLEFPIWDVLSNIIIYELDLLELGYLEAETKPYHSCLLVLNHCNLQLMDSVVIFRNIALRLAATFKKVVCI